MISKDEQLFFTGSTDEKKLLLQLLCNEIIKQFGYLMEIAENIEFDIRFKISKKILTSILKGCN